MNGIAKKFKKTFRHESAFFKAVPALIWQILFFGVPVVLLLVLSFIDTPPFASLPTNFTVKHYAHLFGLSYLKIVARSFFIAFFTATACLLLGYPLTYYIAVKKRKWKNFFLFFLILPFVINLLVLTYAWSFVLDKDGLANAVLLGLGIIKEPILMLNSFFAIMLVMFYCYLPFMIMPLFTSLEKFDLTLIEASRDLGANQWQTFFKVILPLTLPAIQTGFLLVFVPAFGEFVIPLLMGGDKFMFVGTLISHFFLIGQNRAMGAAFTLVTSLALCALIVFFMWIFSSKNTDSRRINGD